MLKFNHKRGDTWRQVFYWKQGSESGPPVDLSGCTARLQLKDKSKLLILDATAYLTIDPINGSLQTDVPASETVLFPLESLYFDIELTFPDGSVQSTETMRLQIVEDITV